MRLALAAALLFAGAASTEAMAQLPNASAGALGMGGNFTAVARGFNGVAWNPAGLGMFDNPKVSFALMSFSGIAGLDPVSMADLKEYDGQVIPASVRQQWLDEIITEGSEQGVAGTDITFLAASIGRVGIQLSASGRAGGNIGPGAAELLLFGNAGRTGRPMDITLAGSDFDVVVTSTAAMSYAQPLIRTENRSFAIGAALKYTFGHMLFTGQDQGGRISANPLEVRFQFPVIVSDTVFVIDKIDNGGGVGLDVGAMFHTGSLSFGVTAKNVFSTFKWDEESLFYRPGNAVFNADQSTSGFDPEPFSAAPSDLRERVDQLVGQPEVAAGVAFQPNSRILVSADFRQRLEETRLGEPKSHIGAGAELRPLSWLPIRAGAALIPGGQIVTGGIGLEFGALNLTASLAQRQGELGTDQIAMFTFSSLRTR